MAFRRLTTRRKKRLWRNSGPGGGKRRPSRQPSGEPAAELGSGDDKDDLEQAESIAEKAATYDGIEDVQFYKDTVDKLLSATRYIQIAAIIVMVFLIIVSIVVVSNTIKLTVFNRASEISIMKYVGATNWFIRGPFLAEGIIIGIISAGISIGLSALVYDKIIDVVGNQLLSVMSMPMVPVGFLVYNFVWIFLALGISIGACGSIISMRKFLDA